jgi:hypothetical protein
MKGIVEEAAMADATNPIDDVHLFISHKKDDHRAAEDIRDTLTSRSGRLQFSCRRGDRGMDQGASRRF